MAEDFLGRLKFDEKGLIAVIIQDAGDGQVLMFAYANKEAVEKTIQTGKMHFYSRSRQKLWLKGETSGNFQHVVEMRHDCDADALLVKVRQKGGACHLGFRSCFSFLLRDGKAVEDGKKMFDPDDVYGKGGS